MTIREGRWLCPHCEAENLGRAESCVACSAARPANVRFYLPGNAPPVTDAALLRDAASGADWICSHCGGANPNSVDGARLTQCRHCGEARDKTDASTPVRSLGVGEAPSSAAEAAAAERAERQAAARSRVADRVARQGSLGRRSALAAPRSLRAAVLAGLAVLLLAAFAFWAWPRTHEGRVVELNWTRAIAVERLGTYVEEGWTLPQGARQIGAERRVRSYRDVVDYYEARTRQVAYDVPSGMESYSCGSTDLGNGYFQDQICTRTTYRTEYRTETYQAPVYRQEPVYDTWLTWEEDHWEVTRTPVAQGGDTMPEWPVVDLHNREREGVRTEELVAVLEDEDGRTRVTLPPETWTALDVGDPVRWRHGPVTGAELLLEP
jgi:hypothetical protein